MLRGVVGAGGEVGAEGRALPELEQQEAKVLHRDEHVVLGPTQLGDLRPHVVEHLVRVRVSVRVRVRVRRGRAIWKSCARSVVSSRSDEVMRCICGARSR